MDDYEARLDELEQELKRAIAAPPADLPTFLDAWLGRLRTIPFSVAPRRRVALLIDAAGQYYLHGQRVFNAVEPIALAVMMSEQDGEQAQLRRALSIQGLILTATRNTPDALRSLLQALELAEGMDDVQGVAAAWVNIAVTFFDATLYNDARVCYERGAVTAASIADSAPSVSLRCRALYGAAQCDLHLHEYLPGIDACDEVVQLLKEPKDREQEQVRALVEGTYSQLLLALHRIDDASAHAAAAREMAIRSGA